MTNYREEPMSPGFAVFNNHVNDAGDKADREFVRIYGQRRFDRHIKPHHDDGIMSIFNAKPNVYRQAWVAMVTVMVNEGEGS